MANRYLEKVAANAYKSYLASKGTDVAGISSGSLLAAAPKSTSAGSFSQFGRTANRISALANPGFKPPPGPGKSLGIGSRVKAPMAIKPTNASRLAAIKNSGGTAINGVTPKGTLQGALQASAAKKVEGAGMGRGLLGKALGFAKKNPLLAAGGAVAAGLAGTKLLNNNDNSSQPMYGGYPQY